MLKPTAETLMSVGNRDHVFQIHYGGTLESASWANVPGIGMVDIAATHITGSTILSTVYTASTLRSSLEDLLKNLLWVGGDLNGNGESVSIVARSIGGGGSALAGLDYEEFA
jgi:hypothetical protein